VEALAELEDLARDACRYYPSVRREDMRWVLVEAADGILPEIGEGLARYAVEHLRSRGIEVHLRTRLVSAEAGLMRLSNGRSFEADTLVWTTGVRANPLVPALGFPVDERGRVLADEYLRVRGVVGAWAAGDCAAVPDRAAGGTSPPTAQHALRQARLLARNVVGTLRGEPLRPFRYRSLGGLVSLGRYKGVATVLGLRLRGFPAWFLHRTYHLSRIPTTNRKIRVMLDWTVALFFRRDVTQLGSLQRPREPFARAVSGAPEKPSPGG
jgi:NADH dehydrogenase